MFDIGECQIIYVCANPQHATQYHVDEKARSQAEILSGVSFEARLKTLYGGAA
jgi:hypothetical protein